jgi:hypothetical protein
MPSLEALLITTLLFALVTLYLHMDDLDLV